MFDQTRFHMKLIIIQLRLKIKSLKNAETLKKIKRKKYFQRSMEPENSFPKQEEKCYQDKNIKAK